MSSKPKNNKNIRLKAHKIYPLSKGFKNIPHLLKKQTIYWNSFETNRKDVEMFDIKKHKKEMFALFFSLDLNPVWEIFPENNMFCGISGNIRCQLSRRIPPTNYRFGTTTKGHPMLICDGHRFVRNTFIPKNNSDCRSYWTCTKYRSVFKCRARAILLGNENTTLFLRFDHNHLPM